MKSVVESDKITRRALALSAAVVVLLFLIPLIFWRKLTQEVPLFYSLPWGEAQITNKIMLFLPAGAAVLFIVINLVLARTVYQDINKDAFLRRVLWVGTAFSIFLGLVTLVRITLLFL